MLASPRREPRASGHYPARPWLTPRARGDHTLKGMAMHAHIVVESAVVPTPRLTQAAGLFDLAVLPTSRLEWDVTLPLEQQPWSVGLITGPSGCGKSTIART